MKDNWYYIYDKSGFDDESINKLTQKLEGLQYKFYQPMGLGAGPGLEQIIVWINNNQFLSGISIGLLTNFLYDILKELFLWFKSTTFKNKTVPVAEFFLRFKDIENTRTRGKIKLRIDRLYKKEELKALISSQIEYLQSSSSEESKCSLCKSPIWKGEGYYIKRKSKSGPICIFCLKKLGEKMV